MKVLPGFLFADTPWRFDPARCPSPLHKTGQFVHTKFLDNINRHQILHVYRCPDCGKVMERPMDVRSVGKRGSIEIDDPRVYRTLLANDDFFNRFHKQEVFDGRHPNKMYPSGLDLEAK